ncbi:hypothetical protein D3C72_2032770 [compost metagenome]
MLEVLHRLRPADEAAGAAAHGIDLTRLLVDVAHRMAAADRACGREAIGLAPLLALAHHHVDDLRDDVAGPLDDHHVADADIAAFADRLA